MIHLPQDTILSQEMDRAEFLKHVGVGAVLLLGGGMIARALGIELGAPKQQAVGYGASTYGGGKKVG